MSINSVTVSGNLAADAELRTTQGGTAVLGFRLAVNERVKQADGTWADRPNWVGCALFGTRAEKLAQHMTKGKKVAVSGRLRYSEWERDGQRHGKLEVIASDVEFMTSAQQGQQTTARQPAPHQAPQAVPQQPDLYDRDIPF